MRVAAILLMPIVVFSQADSFQTAQESTRQKLVAPSAYTKVPPVIRSKIEAQGCSLPEFQSLYQTTESLNVVSGHFAGSGETDWAALCVTHDRAEILLLSEHSTACASEIHSGWPLEQSFSAEENLFLRKASPPTNPSLPACVSRR